MSQNIELNVSERAPRRVGIVKSDARNKSRTVVIEYSVRHPKYGKYIRRRTVLHAHDEANVSHLGDTVEIAQCRPISKTKSWVVTKVVKQSVSAT